MPSDEVLMFMIMQYLAIVLNLLVQLIEVVSCNNISQGELHAAFEKARILQLGIITLTCTWGLGCTFCVLKFQVVFLTVTDLISHNKTCHWNFDSTRQTC